ncbi:unnamed protein product [Cylindrotheca closterium]|uniref:Uncharacterized protein n=1 Tax=Cylindrotheca closterium TaxID=2856 RepID=A0AAD2FHW5_9STRA|nr:unnamed protein product [Cylindrotheca closterium]
MVQFGFHDIHGKLVRKYDASEDLSLSSEINAIKVYGRIDFTLNSYKQFTSMLRRSSNKFNKITLADIPEDQSPEFLAFLVLISNKAKSLEFTGNCQLTRYSTTCLMSTLLQWNGIQELVLDGQIPMTTAKAKLLFEGVASSPCLEVLSLHRQFDDQQVAGDLLIRALSQNRSLERLDMTLLPSVERPGFFSKILECCDSKDKIEASFLTRISIPTATRSHEGCSLL